MKKRRIRRPQPQQQGRTPAPPPPPPPKRRQRWWKLSLRPKLLLIEIPSALLVGVGLLTFYYQMRPTVSPPPVSGDNEPLALPFTIKNESIVAFRNVTTKCFVDQMKWRTSDTVTLSTIGDDHPQPHGNLDPGRSVVANCFIIMAMHNLSPLIRSAELISARAQIVVNYELGSLVGGMRRGIFAGPQRHRPATNGQFVICFSSSA